MWLQNSNSIFFYFGIGFFLPLERKRYFFPDNIKFRDDFPNLQNSRNISKTQAFFSKLKEFSQNSCIFFKNSRISAQKLNGPELLSPVKFQSDVKKKPVLNMD